MHKIISVDNNYLELDKYIKDNKIDNLFVVCLKSIDRLNISKYLKSLDIKITYFNDFNPNPLYESVCVGVKEYLKSGSNTILAVGGGSAIDVAKCIKLFSSLDHNKNYLEQEYKDNNSSLIAMPTTAGTGSEATRYAVIYYNGAKQSITSDSCIPDVIIFDSSVLDTLPLEGRKATVSDSFSHSIESMWSVNCNEESKSYAKEAIKLIVNNMDKYFSGDSSVNSDMFRASYLAGKAINITQTTAGHAMCYKLTSLYGIKHGQAAILVNSELVPFMYNKGLKKEIDDISNIIGCSNLGDYLKDYVSRLGLYDVSINYDDIAELVNSVNVTRLKNNPIKLEKEDIREIYLNLFGEIEKRKSNGSKRISKVYRS